MHKLKEILLKYPGLGLKTLAFLVLPIYWGIIILGHFFTVELKYTKTNKIKFSPHQIAFHVKHPENTFILVLDASCMLPKLYEGKRIRELVAGGLTQAPCATGYAACRLMLEAL